MTDNEQRTLSSQHKIIYQSCTATAIQWLIEDDFIFQHNRGQTNLPFPLDITEQHCPETDLQFIGPRHII